MKEQIKDRIIKLSSLYTTDKEFLKKCSITNYSLVTELRKGRMKNPGSETLTQIVRGSGCSGTWLLTGEGEMFENAGAGNGPNVMYALDVINQMDEKEDSMAGVDLPTEVELQLAKLLVKVLERRVGK